MSSNVYRYKIPNHAFIVKHFPKSSEPFPRAYEVRWRKKVNGVTIPPKPTLKDYERSIKFYDTTVLSDLMKEFGYQDKFLFADISMKFFTHKKLFRNPSIHTQSIDDTDHRVYFSEIKLDFSNDTIYTFQQDFTKPKLIRV